jgi:Peptidase family S41
MKRFVFAIIYPLNLMVSESTARYLMGLRKNAFKYLFDSLNNLSLTMSKPLFSLVCLFTPIFLASCQNSYNLSTEFAPAQLREDFRVLRQSLEEAHPGLYRHISKNELDRLFLESENSLDRPLDVFEFYRILTPLVAAVRCGHTSIELPEFFAQKQDSAGAQSFPALIKIINGKIYIWRDLTDKNNQLAGKEILSINKIPAAQIVSTMLASTGGDGNIQTSRIKRIEEWNFIKKLMPLTGLHSPFEISAADLNSGRIEQIRLEGISFQTLRENLKTWFPQDQELSRSAEIKFIDGGNIAQMTVREFGGFVDDEQKQGLDQFYQEVFEQIVANKTKVLILDLRNNGGGDDRLGTLLLKHLFDEPFEHYKDIVANKTSFALGKGLTGTTRIRLPYKTEKRADNLYHIIDYPNLGILHPTSLTFSGKIYVLMNGGSFSTTAEVISHLHNLRRAEFIGAEAGGAYNGNNSGAFAQVTLPNTKLILQVPLMSYYLSVGNNGDNSQGVQPDYPVDYSISDYLSDTDKEMTLALKMARLFIDSRTFYPSAVESRSAQISLFHFK